MTDNKHTHQVAIVGGGPVGVGLAVELGQRGIKTVLIERRTELQNIPKGQNLTPRTLEHMSRWGVEGELRKARIMPPSQPMGGITAYGNLMSDYWFAPPQREIVRPYYYTAPERLPQYRTEMVLRNRMAELPSVEALMGWTVDSLVQDADGVTLTAKGPNGESRTFVTDYAAGCDGAHSFVRGQIGIERGGADYDQVMVLAVIKSRELHTLLERFPPRSTYLALLPELKGYWQFFGRIDVGEGFFFHAPVPAGTTRDNYDFKALLQRAVGVPFEMTFDYIGFWDMRVSVADRYQVGRVFIAGDSAHSHPPYGGFGLNNGLEDVANLGWKLAAKLQGWGTDKLLASYSDERRPIFEETGRDFIAGRIERDRDFMDAFDPNTDRAAFETEWKVRADGAGDRVLSYEPNYEGSAVIDGPPGGISTAHGEHSYLARAGHHFSTREMSNGKQIFPELGRDFTLVALDAEDDEVADFVRAAKALDVPLKVIRDDMKGPRADIGRRLTLVRPDQYVVWTSNDHPADVSAVIRRGVGN